MRGLLKLLMRFTDKFEGQSKGSTGYFNLDIEYLKRKILHLNQTSIKTFMKRILKVNIWNLIKGFLYGLILLS